jgi:hypothetical protein
MLAARREVGADAAGLYVLDARQRPRRITRLGGCDALIYDIESLGRGSDPCLRRLLASRRPVDGSRLMPRSTSPAAKRPRRSPSGTAAWRWSFRFTTVALANARKPVTTPGPPLGQIRSVPYARTSSAAAAGLRNHEVASELDVTLHKLGVRTRLEAVQRLQADGEPT